MWFKVDDKLHSHPHEIDRLDMDALHQQAERIRQAVQGALDIDARMSAWEIAQLIGTNGGRWELVPCPACEVTG